ncbi:MAG: S41 family peptidase [Planctomycetota bacterium]|jgi:C-terminal processing protease CtpA/Prc
MRNILQTAASLSICFALCAGRILGETQAPPEAKKTEIIIIGTIHSFHHKNPKYSPEVLREIILALKPDAILNELPLSLVGPNGRPIIRAKDSSCPEIWAADAVATQLGVRQVPFDRPDRQENFKKTKYFDRQKQANKVARKWTEHLTKDDPNSTDLRVALLMSLAGRAESYHFMKAAPQIINSDAHDSVIRIKHSLWFDIIPAILQDYPGYSTLISDYHFFTDQWRQRNRIMADNVVKAAKDHPGKRLVVVTGATHRYILRDLLKDEECIDLKEYWQITKPEVERPQEPEGSKQPASSQVAAQTLVKEDPLCGVARLWAAVKYNYALMQYAPVDWDQVLPQYMTLAEQVKNDAEYYLLLEKMVALLKDNHTHLMKIPGRENLHKPNIYLEVVEDQYIVTGFYDDDSHPNVKVGDIIRAVDGRDVEQALQEVNPYICASSETERVNRALDRMLWREKDTDAALTVTRLEKTFDVTLPADIPYRRCRWVAGFDFSHRLIESRYGYMRISNFSDRCVVDEFTKAIEDLRQCKGLILDLRDNSGGNENYGSEIAGRLLNKRIYWYRSLGRSFSPGLVHRKLAETRVRDVNEFGLWMARSTEPSGPWQYAGPSVILVNWRTGSAAEGFVMALHDCGRAVIIGERTPGGTGNPYHVDLPGGARGRICTNAIVRLDGSRFHGVGIKPNIPVRRTIPPAERVALDITRSCSVSSPARGPATCTPNPPGIPPGPRTRNSPNPCRP